MLERLLNEMDFLIKLFDATDVYDEGFDMIDNRIDEVRTLIDLEIDNVQRKYL